MKEKIILTHRQCQDAVVRMVNSWSIRWKKVGEGLKVYGVPRGGIPVAYLMTNHGAEVVSSPDQANLIVDDIIDSGTTAAFFETFKVPFLALASHMDFERDGRWIVFPWEQGRDGKDTSGDDIVIRLLEYIGENPNREGLRETPQRVLKAWKEWTQGYSQDPRSVLTTFDADHYDEMVFERSLPFYSQCEHHLAPFFGTATIAYIPKGKIAGLSKLGRILDVFARRLQVQERLTVQVADALMEILEPVGVGVLIKARHLCMESRGYNKQGHETITSALRGKFVDPTVRAEFLSIAK